MGAKVVDGDERQAARPCDRLRRREPDEERADEARALCDAHLADIRERDVRVLERGADHRGDELEVPPRGDLRDDAAVTRVQIRLRGHDEESSSAVAGDDGGRRLVARRLDAQDRQASLGDGDSRPRRRRALEPSSSREGSASRHMIIASSRLSV